MRKAGAALIDLVCGVVLLAVALFGGRMLLQSRQLVYLLFPILSTLALAFGRWRATARRFPLIMHALLVATPLTVAAIEFFSGRNKPFAILPVVVFVCVVIGGALKLRSAVMVGIIAASAFAGPQFVKLIVQAHDVSEPAIPFTIHLVDGRTITSAQLRGKVVVLDFWATWCMPCQRELPQLQRAYDATKSRTDAAFFAVDSVVTDNPGDAGDTPERASAYFRRYGYTMPLACDTGSVLQQAFKPHGLPTLLVLDREGRVRMRHVGFVGAESLDRDLLHKIDELSTQ